ncbi:hypothetical protein BN1048_00896 [Jeotgalicoccus saudimassiliensis]|uniref:DUF2140 domain-containing protein n=1 Tax=Jeotgalicoccus saudimassiliensis TaxID=1461582 RepID=A0A078M257_9STAP|nr:DUF2140 family protein [Jeotgalicoccus saudimassiliensis]CEA00265.1 hypothetical protein BN1048_00896 [Jeotgalicoccus saudimassiliensis]
MAKNIWMILFFVLLIINIAVIVIIASFLNQSYEQTSENNPSGEPNELEFILTNSTVETLINDNIPYDEFTVNINTEGIDVDIEQEVLGFPINSSISGNPVVNGDNIVIHLTDLNLAGLPLSEDTVYTALRKLIELPEGIQLSERERAIVIDMSLFEQYIGGELQADKIDYENDAWYFSVNNNF